MFDAERYAVFFRGRPLELSPLERALLRAIATRDGRVAPVESLISEAWGGHKPVRLSTVHVTISILRKKLSEAGATGLIRTVRGVGYALHPSASRADST